MKELQLNLTLNSSCAGGGDPGDGFSSSDGNPWPKKRSFVSAFEQTETSSNGIHSSSSNPMLGSEEGDCCFPVGWPPVRKRRRVRSMHVKVNVEGVAITRKVDLSAHRCYFSLACGLASMFGMEECGEYELVYQDCEGDWLLAGDVPWSNFVASVQRMKVFRKGGDSFRREQFGLPRM